MSDNKSTGGIRFFGNSNAKYLAAFEIRHALECINEKRFSEVTPFSIGKVDKEIKEYAANHGLKLASEDIVMTPAQIAHTMRDKKVASGKAIPAKHLVEFPLRRSKMEIYYDAEKKNFLYYDRKRNEKYIIHPNYTLKVARKKELSVTNYITASKTDPTEFMMQKYTKIK